MGVAFRSIVKSCACCCAEYSTVEWESLRQLGVQELVPGDRLDLRCCSGCTTTLARELPAWATPCRRCGSWIDSRIERSHDGRCSECHVASVRPAPSCEVAP